MLLRIAIVLALAVIATVGARAQSTDSLRHARLERDTVIDGVRCAPTGRARARFFTDGRLESCPLSVNTTLSGHALAAGTWVYFRQDRSLRHAWLPRDTDIQGHLCKGVGLDGYAVDFHSSGALALCFPPEDVVIEGVPCRGGGFFHQLRGSTSIAFWENGRLRGCSLSRAFGRNGRRADAGERVQLDASGRMLEHAPLRAVR